jgi:hypothetical protein
VDTPTGSSISSSVAPRTGQSDPFSGRPSIIAGSPSRAPSLPTGHSDFASHVPSNTPSLQPTSTNASSQYPSTGPSVAVLNPIPTVNVPSTISSQPSQFILPLAPSPALSLFQSLTEPSSISPTLLLPNYLQPDGFLAPAGSSIPAEQLSTSPTSTPLQPSEVSEAPSLSPLSMGPGSVTPSGTPHGMFLPTSPSLVPSAINVDSKSPNTLTAPALPSQAPTTLS